MALLLLLAGAGVYLYPHISGKLYEIKVEYLIDDFIKDSWEKADRYEELYQKLKEENERLFHYKQKKLTDAFAYEQPAVDLKSYGLSKDYIGFIEIPVMNVKLPIYLGANEENMKKGAVHLTETSYPINGVHTNCVLAAHRGYSKAEMFRNIELLTPGDVVYIHNIWEKMTYQVKKCCVILPTDTKWLEIKEDKELLTLLTCHPYRHNYQRYVVLCEKQS